MTTAEYAENLEKTLLEVIRTLDNLDADPGHVVWNEAVEEFHREAVKKLDWMLLSVRITKDRVGAAE